jgi:hypothetical protein
MLSSFAENAALDWLFNTETMPTRPTAWYVAAHTADPTDEGTDAELTSADDAGFTRKSITFGAASDGQCDSESSVSWTPTGTDTFTVTHVSVWDSETGGNCLITGELVVSRSVTASNPFAISAADLVATLD